MKRKSASQSAFFNLRVLIGLFIFLTGVFLALFGMGAFSSAFAQGKGTKNNLSTANQASPGTQAADVVQMVGPVRLDQDLRRLPYVPPKPEFEERVLTRYPHGTGQTGATGSGPAYVQQLLKNLWQPAPTMPGPLLTFEGGLQPSSALARRQTATAMSVRVITSKQSTPRSRFLQKRQYPVGPDHIQLTLCPFDGHALRER